MSIHTFIPRSFLLALVCASIFLLPRSAVATGLTVTFNDGTSTINYTAVGDTSLIQSSNCGTDSTGEFCTLVITNNNIFGIFGFDVESFIQEELSSTLSDQFSAVQLFGETSYTATFHSFLDDTTLTCPADQVPCTAETGTTQLIGVTPDLFFFQPDGISASPEPSSILLFAAGVLAILLLARNKLI
jgi:hypothetical protein